MVSVPYEITLLSNQIVDDLNTISVSVPYEITLLSNPMLMTFLMMSVSVPYEITLLSNCPTHRLFLPPFQYLMKLHYSQTRL